MDALFSCVVCIPQPMKLFDDKQFLSAIHSYERQLAKLLALLLAAVVGFAALELLVETGVGLVQRETNWFDGSLIKLLDRLLLIFIALEVLQKENHRTLEAFGYLADGMSERAPARVPSEP